MWGEWDWYRTDMASADAAVANAPRMKPGLETLPEHPLVIAALLQIDMAERAIASVANEMLSGTDGASGGGA